MAGGKFCIFLHNYFAALHYFFKNIKTLQMFIQYSEMLYIIQKLIKVVKEVTI